MQMRTTPMVQFPVDGQSLRGRSSESGREKSSRPNGHLITPSSLSPTRNRYWRRLVSVWSVICCPERRQVRISRGAVSLCVIITFGILFPRKWFSSLADILLSDGHHPISEGGINRNTAKSTLNGNTGRPAMPLPSHPVTMTVLLLVSVLAVGEAYLSNGLLSIAITRHHKGDIFTAQGGKCYKDFCVSLSSGTASPTANGDDCECKCAAERPVFRDDLNVCVEDIGECSLLPFASNSVIRKIPYVFLPLKGQIVYPSADVVMPGEEPAVCVVSGGEFLGQSGWVNLRNSSGADTPFRLFRDEGRTYLQWVGETSLRMAMEGRIILVHLMCKDASAVEEPKVFTPCIGFRVAGKPSVKEMMFGTDVHLKEEYGGGLSVREYLAIGVCSLLLAVVYVAAVVLYLYIRKRKLKNGNNNNGKSASLTLGEEGIIKSNPLLQAARHLSTGHDNAAYVSDSNSCCSDNEPTSDLLCFDDEDLPGPQNMQTSAIIHPCELDYGETAVSPDPNSREKLPEANVSIVETSEVREHPETVKGMSCGNGRRKLYFNPCYFEPDLLKAPPPGAMEFLVKIREVIAIAKHKMSAKKFSPSLLGIPEEDSTLKSEYSSVKKAGSAAGRCESKPPSHLGTPPDCLPSELCWPSDAKQKIIRKWLEDVPVMVVNNDECRTQKQTNLLKSRPWESNDNREDNIPSPPARQERKKKPRAPPVPPATERRGSLSPPTPPRPPPMPVTNPQQDEIPRVQAKDCVPPAVAKNLMDAVIQELTTFKKQEKKVKDSPEKNTDTWEESESKGDARVSTPPTVPDGPPEISQTTRQEDHEYEIILLNPDQPSEEGKDVKIYNLPEILSKNERSEGYSLVSEVYVNDGYSCCSGESPGSSCENGSLESENVHYDVPNEKPGRLTIHVNDSPERYAGHMSESENFEPDTLDRKPRRSRASKRVCEESERYSNQKFQDMECYIQSNNSEKFTDSLERPSGTHKTNTTTNQNQIENNIGDFLRNFSWNKLEGFASLREIYEAKTRQHTRGKETTSLIDSSRNHHDRLSTLSWSPQARHKLLHRGIVLHINHQPTKKHKRTPRRDPHPVPPPKLPLRPPRPTPSPAPRSTSTSPSPSPTPSNAPNLRPLRSPLPPSPPPRPVPPSPPPRSTSSPSPLPLPRSTPPSPVPPTSTPTPPPSSPTPPPNSVSPPPRPPKPNSTPLLPPRNTRPPLPPKHPNKHPKPPHFAARPLPPLPRPSPPHNSLSSTDYEAFYTLPYTDDDPPKLPPVSKPRSIPSPTRSPPRRAVFPRGRGPRPEDSGYLSTDSDSCCPHPFAFSPSSSSRVPESSSQNSETDESLCDGASESGGESMATDSFFYGKLRGSGLEGRDGQEVRGCALRLSDVEVNSDTERHCVPIMVRP